MKNKRKINDLPTCGAGCGGGGGSHRGGRCGHSAKNADNLETPKN